MTPLAVTAAGETELELFGVHANLAAGDRLRVAMSAREDALTSAEISDLFGGSLYRPSDDDAGIEIGGDTTVQLSVPASRELPAVSTDDGTESDSGDDGTDSPGGTEASDGTDRGDTDDETATNESGPGFGLPAAVGGAGGLAYLLSRRFGRTEPTEADD